MDKPYIRLLVSPNEESSIREVIIEGETTVKYDDKISIERRRALVGRPAGTECGSSCTCS